MVLGELAKFLEDSHLSTIQHMWKQERKSENLLPRNGISMYDTSFDFVIWKTTKIVWLFTQYKFLQNNVGILDGIQTTQDSLIFLLAVNLSRVSIDPQAHMKEDQTIRIDSFFVAGIIYTTKMGLWQNLNQGSLKLFMRFGAWKAEIYWQEVKAQ